MHFKWKLQLGPQRYKQLGWIEGINAGNSATQSHFRYKPFMKKDQKFWEQNHSILSVSPFFRIHVILNRIKSNNALLSSSSERNRFPPNPLSLEWWILQTFLRASSALASGVCFSVLKGDGEGAPQPAFAPAFYYIVCGVDAQCKCMSFLSAENGRV